MKPSQSTPSTFKKYAFALGSFSALVAGAHGQVLVASFGFETLATGSTTAASIGGILADTGTGTASSVHALGTTVFSTPAGSGSAKALSANSYSAGDYYQFTINTTGYSALQVAFDAARSATGPVNFTLSYGLNGTSFTNVTTFSLGAAAFSTTGTNVATHYTADLSSIAALNNVTSAYFRLTTDGLNSAGAAAATGGTARVDNFAVTSGVPEPSSIALLSIAGAGALAVARRRKQA